MYWVALFIFPKPTYASMSLKGLGATSPLHKGRQGLFWASSVSFDLFSHNKQAEEYRRVKRAYLLLLSPWAV